MHEHRLLWQVVIEIDDELEVDPGLEAGVLAVARRGHVCTLVYVYGPAVRPLRPRGIVPLPVDSWHDDDRGVPGARLQEY